MAVGETLGAFVRDALSAGRSRADIRQALARAGWSEREIDTALGAWAEVDFVPPVPRPQPLLTARDTFVHALLFTAMTFTAAYLVTLVHGILDLWLPYPADPPYHDNGATGRVRWATATLLVSTPVYLWMTARTARQVKRDPSLRRSLVRKWLTYLALFVSAFIVFGDATYVIYSFLNGEITPRFALKAATVALVAGGVFLYYLRDVEGMRDAR